MRKTRRRNGRHQFAKWATQSSDRTTQQRGQLRPSLVMRFTLWVPMAIQYVVCAGPTPAGSWITDPAVGGGRLVGEACHFVDLCSFLVGGNPIGIDVAMHVLR